jgi:quinol monooxygenase YgiN
MFARVLEFSPKPEKKDELIRMIREEVLPVAKKQPGFLDYLPLIPEDANEKFITVGLWTDKAQAEKFRTSESFARLQEMTKPLLATPTSYTMKNYTVETSLCAHLVDALTTAA